MKYVLILLMFLLPGESLSYDVPFKVYEYDGLRNIAEANFDFGPAILFNAKNISGASVPIIDFFIAHEYAHIVHGDKGYLGTKLSEKYEAMADCYAAKLYSSSSGSNISEVVKYFNDSSYVRDGQHLQAKERAKIIKACSASDAFEKKYDYLADVKSVDLIKSEYDVYVDIDRVTSYLFENREVSKIKGYPTDNVNANRDSIADEKYSMKDSDSCKYEEKFNASKSYDDITYSCKWLSDDDYKLRQLYKIYHNAIKVFYPDNRYINFSNENNLSALYSNSQHESNVQISFNSEQNNEYVFTATFNAKVSKRNTMISDKELANYLDIIFDIVNNMTYKEFRSDYISCKNINYKDTKNNITNNGYRCLFNEDVSSINAKRTKKTIKNILKYSYGVNPYKNNMARFTEKYYGESYYLDYNNHIINIMNYPSTSNYDTKSYEITNFTIEISN